MTETRTEKNLFGEPQPPGELGEAEKLEASVRRLGEQVAEMKIAISKASEELGRLERSEAVPELVRVEIGHVRDRLAASSYVTP